MRAAKIRTHPMTVWAYKYDSDIYELVRMLRMLCMNDIYDSYTTPNGYSCILLSQGTQCVPVPLADLDICHHRTGGKAAAAKHKVTGR